MPVQLHMRRTVTDLPQTRVPGGYDLRTMTRSDMGAWASLLDRNGELGRWDLDRARPLFAHGSPMPLDGSFLLSRGAAPVATAQLHLHTAPDDPYSPVPELGWVSVLPEHRGLHLGRTACSAVLRYAAEQGHRAIFLRTDDHRLAAIRTYLRLGFEPWMYDSSAPGRWQAVTRDWPDVTIRD